MSLQMYHVEWAIDISAESPEEAATKALRIQRDNNPRNLATVFTCIDQGGESHPVDLTALAEEEDEQPKLFNFTLTRDLTESTTVTILAHTLDEAHTHAIENPPILGWLVDDDSQSDPYLPDPSDFEVTKPTSSLEEHETEQAETPERIIEAYRKWATIENHDEGVIEVDENAQVNISPDGGAYVQAWIWVADEEACVCRTCRTELTDNDEGFGGECGSCADKTEPWDPDSHWEEHPEHIVSDWQMEVENDATRQSYVDWVNSQIDLSRE